MATAQDKQISVFLGKLSPNGKELYIFKVNHAYPLLIR